MKIKCFSIVLVSALISSAALAENYWCRGKLSGMYITDAGDIIINGAWRSDWTKVCNLRGDEGVDTVTCSLWSTVAASAVKDSLDVMLMYSLPGGTTCSTIPTYSGSPRPFYLMLLPRE